MGTRRWTFYYIISFRWWVVTNSSPCTLAGVFLHAKFFPIDHLHHRPLHLRERERERERESIRACLCLLLYWWSISTVTRCGQDLYWQSFLPLFLPHCRYNCQGTSFLSHYVWPFHWKQHTQFSLSLFSLSHSLLCRAPYVCVWALDVSSHRVHKSTIEHNSTPDSWSVLFIDCNIRTSAFLGPLFDLGAVSCSSFAFVKCFMFRMLLWYFVTYAFSSLSLGSFLPPPLYFCVHFCRVAMRRVRKALFSLSVSICFTCICCIFCFVTTRRTRKKMKK